MQNWRVSRDAALVFSRCDVLWLLVSPKPASDELVDNNLLLKDFLVCHSSHILRPHFDERITNDIDV